MNLQQFRNALVLSRKLNFTRAAEELNIVQPALSRQIRQLEEELNAELFERNKRNVKLTAAGRYFIHEIDKVLQQVEKVVKKTSQIHEGEVGELRIGFTHSVMQAILPRILSDIKQQMPGMKAILREMNNHDQAVALQFGKLDVGFATNPLVPSDLKSRILHVDNFTLLLPLSHPVDKTNFSDFSVFADEEFIFPPPSDGSNYVRTVESICTDAGFQPKIIHETDSASTSFRLVEAGLGVSFEPASSLRGHEFPIKTIELKDIRQKAELTMIWRPDLEYEYPKLFDLLRHIPMSEV